MPMPMPISIHPTKRRRLDAASSTLSQPFRSPLKVPLRREEDVENQTDTSKPQIRGDNRAAITKSRPSTNPSTAIPSRRPHPAYSTTNRATKDPQLLGLLKQQSSLLLRLSRLRKSLDTAQQALKIESSNSDAELEILISKWKLASREAAEEVFRGARDRVDSVGGMSAWRERERSQKKLGRWDDEPKVDFEALSEEHKERLEVQNAEFEAQRREHAPEKAEEAERDDDTAADNDDSLTMDMMLQSLNIDLDLIGYDKQNQRWHD